MPSPADPILSHDDFLPCFQPILDVASGTISGYESLARRKVEGKALVSAGGLFFDPTIPGEIKLALDRKLRQQAIEYFADKPGCGFLSLNISPDWVDLLDGDTIIPTIEMIRQSGIDPGRVVIEFTERSGELDKLKQLTAEYHKAGLRVAIDDFGVGGSQVDRIIALQPDLIKLDMHLFKLASQGGPEADVALSIASIAQRAGCEIVCEGVETEDEFHFALECGAEYIQGWLFQDAREHTVPLSTYAARINAHKRSYLERKSRTHKAAAHHNREVTDQVNRLCELFNGRIAEQEILAAIDYEALAELGIRRIYICDHGGEQLSPNYEIRTDGIDINKSTIGFNWSHRPYFPLLHAMHSIHVDHVVVSNAYKDANCGAMYKTLGSFISDHRVLLIDVEAMDEVLFQSNGMSL